MGQLICVTLLAFLMTSEEGRTDRPTVSHPRSSDSLTTFNLHLKIWYRTSVAQPTAEDAEQLTKGRLQTRHVASLATGISIHMKRERRNVFPRRTLAHRFQKMSHKRIRHTYRHLSVFQRLFRSTGSSVFHRTIRICILLSTRFPKVIVLHTSCFVPNTADSNLFNLHCSSNTVHFEESTRNNPLLYCYRNKAELNNK